MSEAVKKIIVEYENLRSRKEEEKKLRVVKIYTEYPQIKDIDRKIYLSGAENVKNIIKSPKDADKLNSEYKKKFRELREERSKIIDENGIDPEFDKVKYECRLCSDTGFLENGKKCECFKRRLVNYRYRKSNLSDNIKNENFDNFSFDYYSKEKRGNEKTPYENMKEIYSRSVKFCENFDEEKKGLIFYGGAGLGKTFLSSCIAKGLMDKGKTVMYLGAPRLFSIYEDYRFSRLEDESIMNDIYTSDLLIIDDLGTEPQSKNNLSFFFDLLNDRLSKGKKLIINTNYNMNELTKMYSSRFTSRIYEFFIVYGFYGEDIRIKKLKENSNM